MGLKFFIAGTDTDVGKTYVAVGLIKKFNNLGYSTLGTKPIACGGSIVNGMLVNDDALLLQQAATIKLSYTEINPLTLTHPTSPNIAANLDDTLLSVTQVIHSCKPALEYSSGIHVIEGCGGWHVPLNDSETLADAVKEMNCQVILIVGLHLGCLNHAILTQQAILQAQLPFAGWIANCIDPRMPYQEDNIATLKQWLRAPCLGIIHHQQEVENIINVAPLLDYKDLSSKISYEKKQQSNHRD